ncbi:hypothetical protein [Aurantimonas sp. VKM B-3413]|uniref:hypothetical protein n=1 Tax=Aurantimonas sp. VKM B-3413 TaxID=2779401 RepID=UPI001E3B3980|nr:hypothetical protein [Aurantimonas sp. VKM B-3413]MCB8837569.1 hypothetical protein [Aurantimonas sp. VKM B-3413]
MSNAEKGHPIQPGRANSKTGRVWEIVNSLSERMGRRADRKRVIESYTAEGGNPNTAATQYSYWKKAYDAQHPSGIEQLGSVGRMRLSVGSDGRITVPAEMRAAMLLRGESAVTAEGVDGELRILSPAAALERVRPPVAHHDKGEGSPVDELIAEQRAEAQREDQSGQ